MKALKQLSSLIILLLVSTSSMLAFQKETRDVDTFTKVSLRTSANVYLTQGNTQKVEISGKESDMEKLETKVRDGKLIIDTKDNNGWFNWSGFDKIDVYITVKDLEKISVAGSGDMVSKGKFKCDDLDISVAGSGDLSLKQTQKILK